MSIERDKEIIESATPGPWIFGVYSRNEPRDGTMIGAVAPGHQIRTLHDGGTGPSTDGVFIASARNRWPLYVALAEAVLTHHADPDGWTNAEAKYHHENPCAICDALHKIEEAE